MAGTFTLAGMASGLLSGQKIVGPYTITGSATVGTVVDVTLVSGDNPVSIPPTATATAVFISTSNTATIKIRTVSGDTGVRVINTGLVYVATFDSAAVPATLYINAASSGGTAEVTFI